MFYNRWIYLVNYFSGSLTGMVVGGGRVVRNTSNRFGYHKKCGFPPTVGPSQDTAQKKFSEKWRTAFLRDEIVAVLKTFHWLDFTRSCTCTVFWILFIKYYIENYILVDYFSGSLTGMIVERTVRKNS